MLNIDAEPVFVRTVKARRPDGEGFVEEPFKATFKVLSTDEFSAFDLARPDETADFLRATIVALDDVADGNGRPIAYDEALRERVLRIPYARAALVRAYILGVAEAAQGN